VVVLSLAGAAIAVRALRPQGVRRESGLSVVLITIDTLRADALGCYGNPRGTTPWMDRLAAQGVRFENAHAQNVVTLPSHANILSGRYPFDHGVRDNAGFRFPKRMDTLATILKGRGYRTGAFVSAFPLDSRFGLARGFDVYDDHFGDTDTHTAFFFQERPGAATVAAARRWLDSQGGEPTLCWVHIFEPHFPYDPPEPFASRFGDAPYLGEVATADAALEPLVSPLLEAGPKGRTLVVLTADHGESLGEHGEKTHGLFAYESTLHVPLIVYQPRLLRPRSVAARVRHIDVLPTILDALSLPRPEGVSGQSLLPVATGGSPPPDSMYFEALSTSLNRGWAPIRGVIRDGIKYIELPLPELYDLRADPKEEHNLVATSAARMEQARSLLAGFSARDRGARGTREGEEIRERLRSLGYASAGSGQVKQHYTPADDPKRLIFLDAQIQGVIAHYERGDLDGAIAQCEDLARQRPMPLTLLHLAFLYREKGDYPSSIASAQKALRLSPEKTEPVALIGTYLNESGRFAEAVSFLAPYVGESEPDVDVLNAFGAALAQTGRPREALDTFERIRQIDPENAMAALNTGIVHLMGRDYARARRAMESALALDPNLSAAYNHLGVIAAETQHPDEAIERWKKAVALNPKNWDTLFNLGTVLRKQGRLEEARIYFGRFAEAPPALYEKDIVRVRKWLQANSSIP